MAGLKADFDAARNPAPDEVLAAVKQGNAEVVQALLERGADANAKDNEGCTALMWSVIRGHIKIARLLIDKGAEINGKRERDGCTALILTVVLALPEMARLLIERGASLHERDNGGRTALDWGKGDVGGPRSQIAQMLREAAATGQQKRLRELAGKRPKIRITPRQK